MTDNEKEETDQQGRIIIIIIINGHVTVKIQRMKKIIPLTDLDTRGSGKKHRLKQYEGNDITFYLIKRRNKNLFFMGLLAIPGKTMRIFRTKYEVVNNIVFYWNSFIIRLPHSSQESVANIY